MVAVGTLACFEEVLPVSDQRPQTFLDRKYVRKASACKLRSNFGYLNWYYSTSVWQRQWHTIRSEIL
jgi:hypothetical protein